MQCEKPTADVVLADPPAAGAPPEPVDDGLPPHAAASRARIAVAMRTATVRAGRRGRRMTRVMSFIVPSSWVASGPAGFRFMSRPAGGPCGAGSPLSRVAHDTSRTPRVRRMSSGQAHNVQVRVLVVEDHIALANRIGEGLRDAGLAVDVVYDGAAA